MIKIRNDWTSCRLLNLGKPGQVSAENIAAEDKVSEFSFTDDLDQARRLQLLDVMRKSGSAYAMHLMDRAAGGRFVRGPELLKYLITARLGEGARDLRKLSVCQAAIVVRGHDFKVTR
jgi:hypothetical protein